MNLFELFVKIGAKDEASDKISKLSEKLGNGLKTAAKVGTVAVTAASTAIVALTKQATDSYAEYEQLIGGAELMFGDAFDFVKQKSAEAYKTVQISQNEYLQQVNGFATGLKTALGGNEQAAAELADRIITAEADIIAATGNTAENVQNAFNGIMKSNFTMLDNLQIGITPTKEGFQEVINKVNEWNAANGNATAYQMGNLADMQSALVDYIDMVGMSGYAQAEAAGTITGSLAMTKAAWGNLLTGLADDTADFDSLIENLVESIAGSSDGKGGFLGNIIPRVETALNGIVSLIDKLAPKVVDALPGFVSRILPSVVNAAINLVDALVKALPSVVGALEQAVPDVVNGIFKLLGNLIPSLPEILKSALKIIVTLAQGIAKNTKELTKTIVDTILLLAETITDPDTLTNLVDAAIEIMIALAEGLVEAIPTLIEKAPVIISNLVTAIVENVPKLLKAGYEAIKTIATGITDNIDRIEDAAVEIFETLKQGIFDLSEDLKSVGANIINGIWEGISGTWNWLKEKLGGFFANIIGKAEDDFEIHSPSRVFADIGENISLGLAEGIENQEQAVFDAIEGLAAETSDLFTEKFNKYFNMFDLFEKPEFESISGKELLSNLEDQINAMYKYQAGLSELLLRTGNTNLVSEIEQMGIGALPQLLALLELSDKELNDYQFAYNQKQRTAMTYALAENPNTLTTTEELTKIITELVNKLANNPFIDPETGEIKIYLDSGVLAGSLVYRLDEMLGDNFEANLRGAIS